ncbi:MAG: polyphosphate polymerase domain-containing protein [Candidatus Niyogibacteria bacterium]|nr:polyphosphate polymerase domain-containing protein [Candidatus Niyogibacteria bacterium]
MNKVPKLHFQRFEFKYFLSPQEEFLIKKRIRPFMQLDEKVKNSSRGSYEVWSLYYDSPRLYYYEQKKDGVKSRKKIRWRTYKHDGTFIRDVFFEIKRKHDAVILKDRIYLPREQYGEDSILAQKNDIADEFLQDRLLRSLRPHMLVVYEREPYVGTYNENARMTFDRHIRAAESDSLFYGGRFFPVLEGKTIMEIKFNGTLPFYIHKIVQEFNLERVSYSKYCEAIDAARMSTLANSQIHTII